MVYVAIHPDVIAEVTAVRQPTANVHLEFVKARLSDGPSSPTRNVLVADASSVRRMPS
jgi:hypothetical protein